MPWGYRALFLLNVAYCVAGLISGRLPAWRMFERVEPLAEDFRDASGVRIDLRALLPRDAYPTDLESLLPVAEFACARLVVRGPFTLSEKHRGFRKELRADDCRFGG
jgi:hypothetical protein